MRLEKIEMGGINGEKLNRRIERSWNTFQNIFKEVSEFEGDPTDLEKDSFAPIYSKFTKKISELDSIICKIFSDAMADCKMMESLHRIWIIMGDLVKRPMMESNISKFQF